MPKRFQAPVAYGVGILEIAGNQVTASAYCFLLMGWVCDSQAIPGDHLDLSILFLPLYCQCL